MPYKLTPKQHSAARMVAEGEMPEVIEKKLNMRRYTLNRWRRLKPFQEVVKQHIKHMETALPLRMRHMNYLSANEICRNFATWGQPSQEDVQKTIRISEMAKKLMAELPDDIFDIEDDLDDIDSNLDDIEMELE